MGSGDSKFLVADTIKYVDLNQSSLSRKLRCRNINEIVRTLKEHGAAIFDPEIDPSLLDDLRRTQLGFVPWYNNFRSNGPDPD